MCSPKCWPRGLSCSGLCGCKDQVFRESPDLPKWLPRSPHPWLGYNLDMGPILLPLDLSLSFACLNLSFTSYGCGVWQVDIGVRVH